MAPCIFCVACQYESGNIPLHLMFLIIVVISYYIWLRKNCACCSRYQLRVLKDAALSVSLEQSSPTAFDVVPEALFTHRVIFFHFLGGYRNYDNVPINYFNIKMFDIVTFITSNKISV